MYDTFKPFQEFDPYEFDFKAKNLVIWRNQQKVIDLNEGNLFVMCRKRDYQGSERMAIAFSPDLRNFIENTYFDKLVSSNDRLVMLTLPQNSYNENIQMLSQIYNYTRPQYNFKQFEPYSCSMFMKNGFVSKLTFNISLTDDLVELF